MRDDIDARCEFTWEVVSESSFSDPVRVIVDAYFSRMSVESCQEKRLALADALRAVADHVTPWQPEPTEDSVGPTVDYGYAWALFSKANDIRQELIAIADELESHDP